MSFHRCDEGSSTLAGLCVSFILRSFFIVNVPHEGFRAPRAQINGTPIRTGVSESPHEATDHPGRGGTGGDGMLRAPVPCPLSPSQEGLTQHADDLGVL